MNEIELFEQAVDGLLRDLTLHRDPLDPAPFDREAWVALERGGYTAVGLPEDLDGSGGSVLHCTALARLVGRHAIAAPVVESSFTASWLLSRGGLRRLAGVVTVGGGNHHDALSVVRAGDAPWMLDGTAHEVPWGRDADWIVLAVPDGDGCRVVVVGAGAGHEETAVNLAGEPRTTLRFDRTPLDAGQVSARVTVSIEEVRERIALSIAARAAGAAGMAVHRTVEYARTREQFGRPIAAFQAVQGLLVRCASEAALLDTAVRAAALALEDGAPERSLAVAAAKSLADDCGSVVAAAAHQVHGAAGVTREQGLGSLTQRLWSWRRELGTSRVWNAEIASMASRAAQEGMLWAALAG